jgi:hypothetical protein
MDDPGKLADEKRTYLNDWLNNAKTIADAVPIVQRQLDVSRWESSALLDAPREIVAPSSADLCRSLRQDLGIIKHALPPMPKMDLNILKYSSGSTAATALAVFSMADQARQNHQASIREWGSRHREKYLALQERPKREGEVLTLLSKLKPTLGREFEQASNDLRKCLSSTANMTGAGIAIRNVLEHFKGELINLARNHRKEQKLTWEEVADRLVEDGVPRERFKKQGELWNSLQQRLSRLAKGQIHMERVELEGIFVELVDHLYVTLSLAHVSELKL